MSDDDAQAIETMVRELHDALLRPNIGSSEPPLIEQIREVVKAYNRAGWLAKLLIKGVPAFAVLGGSLLAISQWFGGK